MAARDSLIEHLLRRIGFGAGPGDVEQYASLGYATALDRLINYESIFDDVDDQIGKPGYVALTVTGALSPASNILHARQRWLFRMVHTAASAPGEDDALLAQPLRHRLQQGLGQHQRARRHARDGGERRRRRRPAFPGRSSSSARTRSATSGTLLLAVAKDVAMLVWLDGRTNVKAQPQENFARELMELFTMGVGNYRRGRRLRGRARVHRLEPGAHRRRDRRRLLHLQLRRARITRPPRRSSRSRSTRTAARPFPRARPATACRTASI